MAKDNWKSSIRGHIGACPAQNGQMHSVMPVAAAMIAATIAAVISTAAKTSSVGAAAGLPAESPAV
jgi:hypothetical protein